MGRPTATTCGQCLAGCGILVDAARDVEGDASDPVTQGFLCQNGRASVELLDHPGRLRRPLVRGAPTDWETALAAAARGIAAARDAGGPDAVALYFGAGDPAGSMAFLSAAGFLAGLGSSRHYNVIGLEATHRNVVAEAMLGSVMSIPRPDFERAGGALLLGTNPLVSNDEGGIAAALDRMHRRKAVTVVLDPRRTELARRATVHLQIRPGTDAEVLAAILHVVLSRDGAWAAVRERMDGLERLREVVSAMPPERAAEIAGVPAGDIERAARLLARAAPVTAMSRLGSAMTSRGTLNEWLSWALVGCLGGLGEDGGLVLNRGYLDFERMLASSPRAPGSIAGVLPPADLADAILDRGPQRVRALVVVAGDLVASLPNTSKVEKALRALDHLVVLDVVPTPTTELASVVLPCAHHLEKDDIAMLLPDRQPLRHVRPSVPVAPPPPGVRSEVAIFGELGRRLGTPIFGARAIDGLVRLASRFSPEPHAPGAMSPRAAMQVVLPLLSRFELTWARISRARHGAVETPGGRALRDAVSRPGGRIDLAPERFVRALEATLGAPRVTTVGGQSEGVLDLSTCNRARGFINGKLALVGRAPKEATVRLSPEDAKARGLVDGDAVRIVTDAGALEARVACDAAQRSGAAGMEFGTRGLNRLTRDDVRDPLSQIAAVANVPCRIDRVPSHNADPAGAGANGAAE